MRLLEERRRVHIPDDSKRVFPSKKREVKEKKERKRKREWGKCHEEGFRGHYNDSRTSTNEVGRGGGVFFPGQGVTSLQQGEGESRGINRCP